MVELVMFAEAVIPFWPVVEEVPKGVVPGLTLDVIPPVVAAVEPVIPPNAVVGAAAGADVAGVEPAVIVGANSPLDGAADEVVPAVEVAGANRDGA